MNRKVCRRLSIVLGMLVAASGACAQYPIAGLHPDRRPAEAPVLYEHVKDGVWYREALTGIERPYPSSLKFLEDQGAWYTPFNRPGMTGRYDIRHWH